MGLMCVCAFCIVVPCATVTEKYASRDPEEEIKKVRRAHRQVSDIP